MSASDYGTLEQGCSVNIRRSNGRVHRAIVSGLGPGGSVTVEWFEDNDTKGKEVDLEMVFELNPQYLPTDDSIEQPKPQKNMSRGRPSRIMPPRNRVTAAGENNGVRNGGLPSPQEIEYQEPLPKEVQLVKASRSRRSTVVDEVNKISKNREERRAAQEKQRAKKNQFYDPNNPNWEFAIMVKEYKEGIAMQPISKMDYVQDYRICVCVRKRPINNKEINKREIDVITVPNKDVLIVSEPKTKVDLTRYIENQKFRFDYAFNETCSNDLVYWYTARPLVQSIFEGGMATCFAYGQTGSGKTHTMGGDFVVGKQQDANRGIYALAARDVFTLLKSPRYKNTNIQVFSTFFEIYSGKVYDLLNKKTRLRVLEDGRQQVQIVGLTEREVTCMDDVLQTILEASKCRTSGTTSANQHSSRSHAVFQIILREFGVRGQIGKFSLIDLAGNERGADTTSASRQTRVEGSEINKSLLALKECIRAMGKNGAHLPFRVSKLTQVLRDSFIGKKSRTCMIATISPGISSCEHTLNTLRYADRVKELCVEERANGVPIIAAQNLSSIEEELANVSANESLQMLESSLPENEKFDVEMCKTVSTFQEKEEELVDSHRVMNELCGDLQQLFAMPNDVDYDINEYMNQLDAYHERIATQVEIMQEKMEAVRIAMEEEEEISKTLKQKRKRRK